MRSSRALRLLLQGSRTSHGICRSARRLQVIRNGYCSACEPAAPAKTTAKSTANPPTPPADHRQLAIEQEIFITSIYSPGSPLFLPNGTRMFNKLANFLRAQYSHFGFQEVITPTIYKKSLWEKSGHWENYAADMYSVIGRGSSGEKGDHQVAQDEEYGLKPMNCPGHCLIFASKQRSYRELPVRFADFSPLHRNEISGALSGLTRVRRFHQDDGHIFCRPSQIREEISKTLEFVRMVYQTLGLGPYRLALSTRPKDHYIGTTEDWDNAEAALRQSLDESGQTWTVNEGDGAFYGPKIDIILKDSDQKEHQTATIQLDFQLPKRFELEYQAPAPEIESRGLTTTDPALLAQQGPVTPVLIHRAILGSVERLMALLIEHYNGHWPFWLSPRQAIIITVNDEESVVKYARQVLDRLNDNTPVPFIRKPWEEDERYTTTDRIHTQGISLKKLAQYEHSIRTPDGLPWARSSYLPNYAVDFDDSARSLKKKISEAKRKRYSIIIVVGKKDVEAKTISVDLSGIPDPHGWIRSNWLVKKAVYYKLEGETRNEESEQNSREKEVAEASIDHLPEKLSRAEVLDKMQPLKVETGQLKDLSFRVGRLRRVIWEMESNYI